MMGTTQLEKYCPLEEITHYESLWGMSYAAHPLSRKIAFVPVRWLLALTSRDAQLASNNLHGEMLPGERLLENLCKEGMAHPIMLSVNGVGEPRRVRVDCGQHRVRIAYYLTDIRWLPCVVEVSHHKDPVIREGNGHHSYRIAEEALEQPPNMRAQFMSPMELFARYWLEDIG